MRLLVYLTNPVEWSSADAAGHLKCLQEHKEALLDRPVFGVIARTLAIALTKPADSRSDLDVEVIINSLHLLRNLSFIPDQLTTATIYGRQVFRLQDTLVERFAEMHIFDLLLALCGTFEDRTSLDGERVGHSVLEILYLVFLQTTPDALVACREPEKLNKQRLMAALQEDRVSRERNAKLQSTSARHVRFGGSFAVKTATGDALPFVRDLGQLREYTHDTGKKPRTRAVPHKKRIQVWNLWILLVLRANVDEKRPFRSRRANLTCNLTSFCALLCSTFWTAATTVCLYLLYCLANFNVQLLCNTFCGRSRAVAIRTRAITCTFFG